MLEPVLTIDETASVGECISILDAFDQFHAVVIKGSRDTAPAWFVFSAGQLRWLLEDSDPSEALSDALQLADEQAASVYEGALHAIPDDFTGVVIADDTPIAVVERYEQAAVRRERGDMETVIRPPAPAPKAEPAAVGDVQGCIVPVYFATDRKPTGASGPCGCFGKGHGTLRFGRIDVGIPPGHRRGEIETPKWWKLEFTADPRKHITLERIALFDAAEFTHALDQQIAETSIGQALVFVHGYNVGFDSGIKRTAQIAYDLHFYGVSILYSWPSRTSLIGYTQDEASARRTEPHFTAFLKMLLDMPTIEKVHVMAHSMGNRVVAESLYSLPESVDTRKINQMFFAAPDIDAETFEAMAQRFASRAKQFTLYASSRDMALRTSKMIHGGQRAGDSEPSLVVVDGVDTVDASSADTDLLGHSYIGDSTSILADIHHVLKTGDPPEKRDFFLRAMEQAGRRYWAFVS